MIRKLGAILLEAIPILLMIGLIPLVQNDYVLTGIYCAIIVIALAIKREPKDPLAFVLGFFIMIGAEYIFVSTGVEEFKRTAFFGFIPLWLPFIWGYGYVAIKRGAEILRN